MATEAVARRGDGGRPSAGWSGGTRQTRHQQTHRPTRAVFFCVLTGKSRLLARATKSSSRVSHRPFEPSTARHGTAFESTWGAIDRSSRRPIDRSATALESVQSRLFVDGSSRPFDRSSHRPLEPSSRRAIDPSSRPGTAHESTQFIKSSSDQSRWATQPPRTRVRESRLRRLLWFTRVSSTTTANVMCA